jgi:hypothetical protein
MTGRGQCIKLYVLIVVKNAKYHSDLQKEGRSTVDLAGRNTGLHEELTEDIRIRI